MTIDALEDPHRRGQALKTHGAGGAGRGGGGLGLRLGPRVVQEVPEGLPELRQLELHAESLLLGLGSLLSLSPLQ